MQMPNKNESIRDESAGLYMDSVPEGVRHGGNLFAVCDKMISFLKKRVYPIGVDIGTDSLKMVQLAEENNTVSVVGAMSEKVPGGVECGSGEWQRWVAGVLQKMLSNGRFRGRTVVTAVPSQDVFVDEVRVPRVADEQLEKIILSKAQDKFSFAAKDAMVKYVVTNKPNGSNPSELDVLVMAVDRVKVDRCLAIYENTDLEVKTVGVWPLALTTCYTKFFGRRASDKEAIVMLLETGASSAKVVICRGSELLFARVIPIGVKNLAAEETLKRLILELAACDRFFESVCGARKIERLIYLSNGGSDRKICEHLAQLAQRWHVLAQVGDVLGTVDIRSLYGSGFERRGNRLNWATAFGLSLL